MAEQQQSPTEYIHNVKDGIDAAFVNLKQIIAFQEQRIKELTVKVAELEAAKSKTE